MPHNSERWSQWLYRLLTIVLILAGAMISTAAIGQRRTQRHKHVTKLAGATRSKRDEVTLRYKPQLGTLLYNVRTDVRQRVESGGKTYSGEMVSSAQLAYHNIATNYHLDSWTFEEYFTKFLIQGHPLVGDSIQLHENGAINKITRLTYRMTGHELEHKVIDSLRLLNAEAQTNAYYFRPLSLLIPLPVQKITYGYTWSDEKIDTMVVYDTVNIGTTAGLMIYDIARDYKFVHLLDTLGYTLAVIIANQHGTFTEELTNSVTHLKTISSGPLHGTDTTYLDLLTGRVMLRTNNTTIPAKVEVTGAPPFVDDIDVRSVVVLDESNAIKIARFLP